MARYKCIILFIICMMLLPNISKAESEYDFYEKIKEYENTLNKVSNNSVDSSTLDTSNKAIILSILGCILIIFLAFVLKKVKQ